MNTPQKRYYRRLIEHGVPPRKVARFNKYLRTLNRSKLSVLPLSSLYRIFDEQTSERARRAPGALGRGAGALGRGAVSAAGALGKGVVALGRGAVSAAGTLRNRKVMQPLPENFLNYVRNTSMTTTKAERFAKWYSSLPNTRKQIYGKNYRKAHENFNRSIGERAGRFVGVYKSQRNLPIINSIVQGFINNKTNNRNKKLRFINYYKRLPANLKTQDKLKQVYNNFNRSAGERARRAPGALGRGTVSAAGAVGNRAAALRANLGRRAGQLSAAAGERAAALRANLGRRAGQFSAAAGERAALLRANLGRRAGQFSAAAGERAAALRSKATAKISSGVTAARSYVNKGPALRNEELNQISNYYLSNNTKKQFRNYVNRLTIAQKKNKNMKALFDEFFRKTGRSGISIGQKAIIKSILGGDKQVVNLAEKEAFIKHIESIHPANRKNIGSLYDKFSAKNVTPGYIKKVKTAIGLPNNVRGNQALELNKFITRLKNIPVNQRNTINKITQLYSGTTSFNLARQALGIELSNEFKKILKNTPYNQKNTEQKIVNLYKKTMGGKNTVQSAITKYEIPSELQNIFKNYVQQYVQNGYLTRSNVKNKFYLNRRRNILNIYGRGKNFTNYWMNQNIKYPINNLNNLEYEYYRRSKKNYKNEQIAKYLKLIQNQTNRNFFETWLKSQPNYLNQSKHMKTKITNLARRFQNYRITTIPNNPNLMGGFENIPNNNSSDISL